MAVLDAASHIEYKDVPQKFSHKCAAADTFYSGGLLFTDGTTGKCKAVPAAGDHFAGFVAYTQITTAADQEVECFTGPVGHSIKIPPVSLIDGSDVGSVLYMDISADQSDNPVDTKSTKNAAADANDIKIGKIQRVDADGVWIAMHEDLGIMVADIGFGAGTGA